LSTALAHSLLALEGKKIFSGHSGFAVNPLFSQESESQALTKEEEKSPFVQYQWR
jgi:hypothetical protein